MVAAHDPAEGGGIDLCRRVGSSAPPERSVLGFFWIENGAGHGHRSQVGARTVKVQPVRQNPV